MRTTSAASTSAVSKLRSLGPVRRFFTDTRTIAAGAVLTVFGVVYVVRQKYFRHDTASKQ